MPVFVGQERINSVGIVEGSTTEFIDERIIPGSKQRFGGIAEKTLKTVSIVSETFDY